MKKSICLILIGFIFFSISGRAQAQEYDDTSFIRDYRMNWGEAQEKYIDNIEAAEHYCALVDNVSGCMSQAGIRLLEPVLCDAAERDRHSCRIRIASQTGEETLCDGDPDCMKNIACKNKDLSICRKLESLKDVKYCLQNFVLNCTKEVGEEMSLKACEFIKQNPREDDPKGNDYAGCIRNIVKNVGNWDYCELIENKKNRNQCYGVLTFEQMEEKWAMEEAKDRQLQERIESFDGILSFGEPGFYYASLIYLLFALILVFAYFKLPYSFFRRPLIFVFAVLLIIVFVARRSLRLVTIQDMVRTDALDGVTVHSHLIALHKKLFAYGLPDWLIIAWHNILDLLVVLLPLIIAIIVYMRNPNRDWRGNALLFISIGIYILLNAAYFLLGMSVSLGAS